MTEVEKLRFNVISELDVFISILSENGVVTNPEVRKFIRDFVIPRLTKLRMMVNRDIAQSG